MTLLSNCANCINHCCRRPLISEQEIQNIENKYNITLELSNNETQHLTKIYKNRIKGPICQLLGEHGCILNYEDKPVICKIYPWIPYQFVPPAWELLLDVTRCDKASQDWTLTYLTVKKEFNKIIDLDPAWQL
ncbi:MAG: YkgJ family cysteine cluster protein [Candidatus Paceibacterota bacterium]|jgi:hypothetical protein|nr:YkgJ family cysteine cluster protein [Bacilli bacterium]